MVLRRVLTVGLVAFATSASAADFSNAYFFGDSLTYEGPGQSAPIIWPSAFRAAAALPAGANFAVPGADTASLPTPQRSFLGQISAFIAGGPAAADSGAGIWIGTNNIQLGSLARLAPGTIASSAAADVRTGIQQLLGAGVQKHIVLGTYDMSLANSYQRATGGDTLQTRLNAASASQSYNAQLAALSVPGASIRFYDIAAFIHQLQRNPQLYGFQQILPLRPGVSCGALCQQQSIFADDIHLSARTQKLIGEYVAGGNPVFNGTFAAYGAMATNIASSNTAAAVPLLLSENAVGGLTWSLLDRLAVTRTAPAGAAAGSSAWSLFAYGGYSGGNLLRLGSTPGYQADLDYGLASVSAGAQYQVGPGFRIGAAFGYGHARSDLSPKIGVATEIDSFNGALFASLAQPNWYLDGVVAGGSASLDQTRTGSFGQLRSKPNGEAFAAAARGAYLFDIGWLRAGPVAGFGYARGRIGRYGETGDPLYAVGFRGQELDGWTVHAGLELQPMLPAAWASPFLRVTYERAEDGKGVSISSTFATLATQSLPDATIPSRNADAVKVAGGASVDLGGNWSGSLSGFGSTAFRTEGSAASVYSYGVNAQILHRF